MLGRREEMVMSIVNLVDNYRRDLVYYTHWLFSKELRNELSKTKTFKNKHKGQRCFIVGNGPSLVHHDLNVLKDEVVFTVNFMMKSPDFKTLNPNYHLFVDPIVFELNQETKADRERISMIESTNTYNPNLVYIIPYRRKSNFNVLFTNHKFLYLYNYKVFTQKLKNISCLHRVTPGFHNVIIYAINVAIYMGFKEIYLIGVDMTGFLENFEYNKVNDQWGHSYTKSEDEKLFVQEMIKKKNIDNEFYLKTYGKTFEQLKLMYNYACSKNVKLVNASQHGAIDFIPRVDYKSLFTV